MICINCNMLFVLHRSCILLVITPIALDHNNFARKALDHTNPAFPPAMSNYWGAHCFVLVVTVGIKLDSSGISNSNHSVCSESSRDHEMFYGTGSINIRGVLGWADEDHDQPWDSSSRLLFRPTYPLVCYIAMENGHRNSDFAHSKW